MTKHQPRDQFLPSWTIGFILDDRGRPVPNLANAMVALRAAPEVERALAFDEMLRAPILLSELPAAPGSNSQAVEKPRLVLDTDVTQIQEWLQYTGLPKIGKDTIHSAVDLRAQERAFHPVRDYLDALVWDGSPRLTEWLATYLGAEATPYTAGIGRMFMVALVARIYEPGCKCDYMLVLEGPQGVRKSTACEILGYLWFSDSLPDVTAGKDVSDHLTGKWLIEVGEMSALSKAESAHLKAFITRTVERYRPAYGRREIIRPRQCVFIGTTNKAAYLRDETGARRFWPVKVTRVDTDALKRDRDLLFAEAVRAYREGARWWPSDTFEREHIRPQQDSRFEADAWAEPISKYLSTRSLAYVGEVARDGLGLETPRISTLDQRRITAIMERLDWERGSKDRRGNIPWRRAA